MTVLHLLGLRQVVARSAMMKDLTDLFLIPTRQTPAFHPLVGTPSHARGQL